MFRLVAPAAVLAVCAIPALAAPDEPSALERRVKAAFLYKFAAYVTWPTPPASDSSFTIGIVGDDALAAEVGRVVAGRTVNGLPVAVRPVAANDSLTNLHMLFVSRSRVGRLESIAAMARERSVLTVSEAEGALAMGSVINFVLSSGKVRFEISLGAARKSGLALSSRLLGVALSVVDDATAEPGGKP